MDNSSIDATTDNSGMETEDNSDDDILTNNNNDDNEDESDDEDVVNEAMRIIEGGGEQNTTAALLDTSIRTEGDINADITPPVDDGTGAGAAPSSVSGKKRANSEVSTASAAANNNTAADDNAKQPPTKKKKTNSEKKKARKACEGLTIPFRTIKRIMKSDPSVGIIQNDAAIVVTAALEHFVKDFAVKSLNLAKEKGRNNFIKYDDVAEVRAADRSLNFLDMAIP